MSNILICCLGNGLYHHVVIQLWVIWYLSSLPCRHWSTRFLPLLSALLLAWLLPVLLCCPRYSDSLWVYSALCVHCFAPNYVYTWMHDTSVRVHQPHILFEDTIILTVPHLSKYSTKWNHSTVVLWKRAYGWWVHYTCLPKWFFQMFPHSPMKGHPYLCSHLYVTLVHLLRC